VSGIMTLCIKATVVRESVIDKARYTKKIVQNMRLRVSVVSFRCEAGLQY